MRSFLGRLNPRLRRPDVLIPTVAAVVMFVGLYSLSLMRWYTFLGSYDIGYFQQGAWLLTSGQEPFITMRGLHILGDHAVFIFYPMAWVTEVLPTIPTFLAIQAGALALGAIPLWIFARRVAGLGLLTAAALLAAYALYPALHNINLFDFHPEVVAVPALLASVLLGLSRRWLLYAGCVAIVLLAKEDLAVVVMGLGVLMFLEQRRRAGLITIGVAALWLLFDLAVVLPHFTGGELSQSGRWSQYGESAGEVISFMLRHPVTVATDFASSQNLATLVGLFGPLCFLSLLSLKWLLPGIPLQFVFLQSNVVAAHTLEGQYTIGILGFAFIAAAMSLARATRGTSGRTVVGAVVLASLFFFVQLSSSSPSRHPWKWRDRDRVDHARIAASRLVPHGAAVTASVRMWPLIADRTDLYNFPMPFERYEGKRDPVPLQERVGEVQFVVLDTADKVQWTPDLEEVRHRLLPQLGFRQVFDREGIVVYTR